MPTSLPPLSSTDPESNAAVEIGQKIGDLDEGDMEQYRAAKAWLLAHPDADEVHRQLVGVLDVSPGAIYVLGHMGRAEDAPRLAAILEEGGGRSSSFNAAMALGSHPHPSALAALRKAVEHSDTWVVRNALSGLGLRGDQSVRPLVERTLMHDDEHVRRLAVHALNDLGVASSVTVLRTLRDRETSAEVIEIIDLALAGKLPTTAEMTR